MDNMYMISKNYMHILNLHTYFYTPNTFYDMIFVLDFIL